MKNKDFIIISAGGTGGHIFPAQAIAEELLKIKSNLFLVTDKRGEKFLKGAFLKIPKFVISSSQSNKGGLSNKVFNLLLLSISSLRIMLKFLFTKPKLVIVFGGYPTFPAALYALIFRMPLVLHEQNLVLGQINRLFLPFAKNLFISFPGTQKIKKKYKKKVVLTGLPIRFIKNTQKEKGKKNKLLQVLVLGGSQGAKVFSDIVPLSIKSLDKSYQEKIQITQQVREENLDQVLNIYLKTKCTYIIKPFFDNIEDAYNKNDLVISRSGASSISEIMAFDKPAILIPYPKAKDNHQYYNAKFLEENFGSILVEEKIFSTNWLADLLKKVIDDPKELSAMQSSSRDKYIKLHLNATCKFIEEL